jgi:transposase
MTDSGVPAQYRLRVKQRMVAVRYAEEHGIKPAARHCGVARRTVRTWLRRWKAGGEAGLVPRYPSRRPRRLPRTTIELIRIARVELEFGAPRTRVWLHRVHQLHVNARTIQRVFRDLGRPRLTKRPRRRPRQMKLFEKEQPGESVQVDVKVVTVAKEKVFQYTALDDCTRMRVLRLYPRLNQHASLHFLGELASAFPFPVHKIQCDNGLPQKSRRHSFSDLTWSAFEADARRQAVPPVRNHTLTIVTQGQRSSICPDTASQSVAFQVEGPSIIYEVACASTALGEGILPPGLIASGKRR